MYQTGDQVVYGIHGVCRVVQIEQRITDKKQVTYLVLEPEGQSGSRYLVPTHNAAAMAKLRPMLTAEELEALLTGAAIRKGEWIPDENRRKQLYRELVSSCDRKALLNAVGNLYLHQAERRAAGKRCHQCDENFLRDAEKLLSVEIAMVMNMEQNEARDYLWARLKGE